MRSNFHTHSTFCDGKNTPEEIVLKAMEKEFSAIGFSSHGYTGFDTRYCLKDTDGYIKEIHRLKKKYGNRIQIHLGVEEDAFCLVDRSRFDYIIGSCHYFRMGDRYLPIDSNYDCFKRCLAAFDQDVLRLAEAYYDGFCQYIASRKPDIIGHFDLITKFDELDRPRFFTNEKYKEIAAHYISEAAKSGCLFEVNTGAISRGLRTAPYPSEELLYTLKKRDAGLILSSDSHAAETIDFQFDATAYYLRCIGFTHLFTRHGDAFVQYEI